MENGYKRFVEKAESIIADCPKYATDDDKVAILNRKFRLGRQEARDLLKTLKS